MEIFVAIVPLAAVVVIAVWSGMHAVRLARPKLEQAGTALGGAAARERQV